jgi:hypothetical protein
MQDIGRDRGFFKKDAPEVALRRDSFFLLSAPGAVRPVRMARASEPPVVRNVPQMGGGFAVDLGLGQADILAQVVRQGGQRPALPPDGEARRPTRSKSDVSVERPAWGGCVSRSNVPWRFLSIP